MLSSKWRHQHGVANEMAKSWLNQYERRRGESVMANGGNVAKWRKRRPAKNGERKRRNESEISMAESNMKYVAARRKRIKA